MAKYTPRDVQKELESGEVWPVYWLYGAERMKAKELLRKIQTVVCGPSSALSAELSVERLDASELSENEIVDRALSPGLFAAVTQGLKLYVVSEAHRLSEVEPLEGLFGPKQKISQASFPAVVVFLSKDLDARKKLSKALLDHAAVVECEAVRDDEKAAWVGYLSKRRGLSLPQGWVDRFCQMEPWSLELVDLELEKLEIAWMDQNGQFDSAQLEQASEVLHLAGGRKSEEFISAFLQRNHARSLDLVRTFADSFEEALPLMGLLSWNARQLLQTLSDQESGARTLKLSPQMQDRFRAYSRLWSLGDAIELQGALAELDFSLKQTSRENLAVWTQLVNEFALHRE